MSLSGWFREYLYIPLGGNRKGRMRTILNKMIVFFCTGLWHGASWNYVLWGIYWGIFIIVERLFLQKWLLKVPKFISHFYLIVILLVSWSVFRMESLNYSLLMLKGMLGLNSNAFTSFSVNAVLKNNVFLVVFSIIASTPLLKKLMSAAKNALRSSYVGSGISAFAEYFVIPCGLLLLSTAVLVGASYNPFLYFRF